MRVIGVIAVTLAAALSSAWAGEPVAPTRDPVAGARLFESKGCAHCHAVKGVGGGQAPDLGRAASPRSFYDMAATMWNHLPGMAARIRAWGIDRPYLTSDEISDVAAYLYAPAVADDRFLSSRGDVARGRQLVHDKGCLGCHSLEPPSRTSAGSLNALKGLDSPWVIVSLMWNHAFLMEVTAQAQGRVWPRFTAEEMGDLVAFLRAHAYGKGD